MKLLTSAFRKRRMGRRADAEFRSKLNAEMNWLRQDFDEDFYLHKYVDIRGLGVDPLMHYCLFGWQEGRDPCVAFSTNYYLRSNGDVAERDINPFLHYIQEGRREGRPGRIEADVSAEEHEIRKALIRSEFDVPLYQQRYAEVAEAGIDPVEHYYVTGWREGRDPALGFSTAYYLATNEDILALGVNPFWHYLLEGRAQGRVPTPPRPTPSEHIRHQIDLIRPRFNAAYYLNRYPDVAALGYDPIEHYCISGWLEGRDPCPEFSTLFYLQTHEDIAAAEINPFWHYLGEGENEGRAVAPAVYEVVEVALPVAEPEPVVIVEVEEEVTEEKYGTTEDIRPYFDVSFYRSRNPDLGDDDLDPVEHYWNFGWKEGRDPSPDFSTQYYLESNPDIAAKANIINPFWHYIMSGRHEGRMPQHPGGYRVEKLRHTETMEQNVKWWLRKVPQPALMDQEALRTAIGEACAAGNGELILSVGHDHYLKISGGVQLCIHHEELLASERGATYLNLHPWQPLPRMAHEDQDADPIMVLVMNGADLGRARISVLEQAVADLSKDLTQARVVIHHLLGHLPERIVDLVRATGQTECWLWLHDFFSLCPSYALQRNGIVYCGAPPVSSKACSLCRYGAERKTHVPRIDALFKALDVHVISPSDVTLALWTERGTLKAASTSVLPHMKLAWHKRVAPLPVALDAPITIGFLGTPAAHKGWDVFEALNRRFGASPQYRFVYFGSSKFNQPNLETVDVHVTGENPDAMIDAVRGQGCDLVLHWASWPETFSFSTFEAMSGGAYVLTNPISGNVAATVQRTKRGAVLPDEAALFEFFETDAAGKLVTTLREERAEKEISHGLSQMAHEFWDAQAKGARQ